MVAAFVTIRASSDVDQEAIQSTNKELGSILAEDFEPMLSESFDQQKIEETQIYDERWSQIATEMMYMISQIQ